MPKNVYIEKATASGCSTLVHGGGGGHLSYLRGLPQGVVGGLVVKMNAFRDLSRSLFPSYLDIAYLSHYQILVSSSLEVSSSSEEPVLSAAAHPCLTALPLSAFISGVGIASILA